MKRIKEVSYWAFIIWVFLIMVFSLNGLIAFGSGLGDLFYLMLLLVLALVASAFYYIGRKDTSWIGSISLAVCIIGVIVLYTLKMTIWRGA